MREAGWMRIILQLFLIARAHLFQPSYVEADIVAP